MQGQQVHILYNYAEEFGTGINWVLDPRSSKYGLFHCMGLLPVYLPIFLLLRTTRVHNKRELSFYYTLLCTCGLSYNIWVHRHTCWNASMRGDRAFK